MVRESQRPTPKPRSPPSRLVTAVSRSLASNATMSSATPRPRSELSSGWPAIGRIAVDEYTTVTTNTARASRKPVIATRYYNRASSASPTVRTPTTSSPSGTSAAARLLSGITQRVNPSCRASRARNPACVVVRTSPASPISPNTATCGGHGAIAQARRDRGHHREIRSRLIHGNATRHVHEHIVGRQIETGALVQHCEQQRQAIRIQSARRSPGIAERRCTDERLHFDEDRPRSFNRAEHRGARDVGRPLREKQLRRIHHRLQAGTGHLEHAKLVRRAEAVLHRANHAMGVMLLALEVEHRVDDMLEHLGSGQAAVLRDMADENRRQVAALCREQQIGRRLPDLSHAARSRLQLQREHRLDRVDDQQCRLDAVYFFNQPFDAGLGEQVQGARPTPSRCPRSLIWCSDSSPEQ